MKKPGTRGGWPNILKIGINLAFLEEKMGAELNEMAIHHSISSITNTIWYIDVGKYQSWRKLLRLSSVRQNYFFGHILTI